MTEAGGVPEQQGENDPKGVHSVLNKALALQAPLTERHIARIRRNRPDATPAQVVSRLNTELRAATISTGIGVGATAAAPGVGTATALAVTGGETLGFLNVSVLYVLARSEVHGIRIDDIERRRTLVMAMMLGESGAATIGRVAERTGQHWAKQIVSAISPAQILAINKILGRNFVTKYGTKQGIIVLGRAVPFGIGAVIGGTANGLISHGIIKAGNHAFGQPPAAWNS